MNYNINFDESQYTIETIEQEGKKLVYRAFEHIVYVQHPVDLKFQTLSIFVPEAYYQGESIGNYSLKTAPIFFPNTVGGYMPGAPERPGKNFMGKTNATFFALLQGYVVVSAGARGRGLKDEQGKFTGAAPACLVDLKAAIRYLRHNASKLPGDTDKIISNGTSAGGALSSLLGATGNHPDYEPYLKELGAANERDDIFAASCYCPITNLDHADMAYEWEFCGYDEFHRMKFEPPMDGSHKPRMTPIHGTMSKEQIALSKQLFELFPSYLNGLQLKGEDGTALVVDENGNGTFKEYITSYVMESAQKVVDQGRKLQDMMSREHQMAADKLEFLEIEDGKVKAVDFDKYIAFRTRMKQTPAFDNVSMGTPENQLFCTADIEARHFTTFSTEHSLVNGMIADELQVKMMNPMNYIGDGQATTAKNYRIRHGAVDRDTSLAISAILTATLRNNGVEVDYHLPWGVPHAGDYDLVELFAWIDKVCQGQ